MYLRNLIRKVRTVISKPKVLPEKGLYLISRALDDQTYLKVLFSIKAGYKLNLNSPKTYNEKLQWLKINYRKPIMTKMVDKYTAKDFVSEIIGEEYIVTNYGVWDSFSEIDFNQLPQSFVLKTTHDQGGVVIVKDKDNFDIKAANQKLNRHLKVEHYYLTREWPYKNVKPRIMAERLLISEKQSNISDYKFYCFHGEPKLMYISHMSQDKKKYLDFFDMEFNRLNISRPGFLQSDINYSLPENWQLMKELAGKLSSGFPHLRVDFYNVEGKVYLGELTFFQGGGMMPFEPVGWDNTLGDWIDLSSVKNEISWKKNNENC